MQIITGKRRSGKTTKLIELCAENGGYIVCMHRQHAHGIAQMAREMGLQIPAPITFDEFVSKDYYPAGIQKFYIDDAERLLQYLTPVRIKAISVGEE